MIRSHQTPEWVSAHTFFTTSVRCKHMWKKKNLLVKSWCTQVFPGNGGHVFLCMSEFLFAFTFFYVNSGKENKNIMTGLKEITGCHSSETHACVCREVKLACADMSVWMVTAGGREGAHTCVTHEELTEPFSLMLVLTSSLSNSLSRGTKQPLHDDKKKRNKQNRNIPNSWACGLLCWKSCTMFLT